MKSLDLLDEYQKVCYGVYTLNLDTVIYNLLLDDDYLTCAVEKRVLEYNPDGSGGGILSIYFYTKDCGFQYYRAVDSDILRLDVKDAVNIVELDRL